MCTIITCDGTVSVEQLEKRMRADAISNSDGWSILTIAANGEHSIIRTLSLELAVALATTMPYTRIFIHARAATQGESALENCHGWSTDDGLFYFHNGILSSKYADRYAVDSQLIGYWLNLGVGNAVEKLKRESYANVLVADVKNREYTMIRRKHNTLFTDGKGNYSTCILGDIAHPVAEGAVAKHPLDYTKAETRWERWEREDVAVTTRGGDEFESWPTLADFDGDSADAEAAEQYLYDQFRDEMEDELIGLSKEEIAERWEEYYTDWLFVEGDRADMRAIDGADDADADEKLGFMPLKAVQK